MSFSHHPDRSYPPGDPTPENPDPEDHASEDPDPEELGPEDPGPSGPGTRPATPAVGRGRVRRAGIRAIDLAAAAVVFAALVAPDRLDRTTPGSFARVPVEALLGAVLVLLLPGRPGRVLAGLGGLGLGLLTVAKVLDTGFHLVLGRPFDAVTDGAFLRIGAESLSSSFGHAAATGAVVAAPVLAATTIAVLTFSVVRLATLTARYRSVASLGVGALALLCVTGAAFATRPLPHIPRAVAGTTVAAYDHVTRIGTSLRDERAFAAEVGADRFASVPGTRMLTGLRGKNVLIVFVESYGRSALQDPRMAPEVGRAADSGTAELEAAGFGCRSGWLTSPTYGGSSWFAHSTLQSGLWIDSQARYRNLVGTRRLTLSRAFHRAGWRTVGVEPAIRDPWPEGRFFGYDSIYDLRALDYRGPGFGYSPVPDQYVMSTFQRREVVGAAKPVMAELVLTSSHLPWAPLPEQVPWASVGDGSVFTGMPARGRSRAQVWTSPTLVRAAYARSVRYSLTTLVSYLTTYGDDDTVMFIVGDHQPAAVVTDERYGRDVPVTLVAGDPTVLGRAEDWGWTPGLRPAPQAPVWPMSAFRDRFLTDFGLVGGAGAASGGRHR